MTNTVLTITELNGEFALEMGDNMNCAALTDLQKNWNKLDTFTNQKGTNVKTLSGFVRNYLIPSLSILNDGNIARGINIKNKTPEVIKKETEELRSQIEIKFNGFETEKRRTKGIFEIVKYFNEKKWNTSDAVGKCEIELKFLKTKKLINAINTKIQKYSKAEYSDQSFVSESLNKITTLNNSLLIAYNSCI
jgi:hypothetical protein